MVALPEPAVQFGAPFVVAILWVAKGYILSVYRGEREFKTIYAAKTVLLGIAATLVGFITGADVATAASIAVVFVDDIWNAFSSTWNRLDELPIVERFDKVANQLIDEHGDEAAEIMDGKRKELTGKYPTDSPLAGLGDAAKTASESTRDLTEGVQAESDAVAEGQAETNQGNSMANTDEAPPEGSVSTGTSPAEASEGESGSERTVTTADGETWSDSEAAVSPRGGDEKEPDLSPLTPIDGVGKDHAAALHEAGYRNQTAIWAARQSNLAAVEGIGNALAARIKADVGGVGVDMDEKEPDQEAGKTPSVRVAEKVNEVPETREGWLKLRAVAALVPAIDGNDTRDGLRMKFRRHADNEAVLDAFATVEARSRGEERAESGESA